MESILGAALSVAPEGSFRFARWLFLRALGLIYAVAFLSLAVQVRGLLGSDGILPAGAYLRDVRRARGGAAPGSVPTLFWLRADDTALVAACGAGLLLALALTAGLAPPICLLLLWALYLSFAAVGRDFLSFQWDVLLLEAGFTAVLLAPWRLAPAEPAADVPAVALLLFWWLLFRLHVQSGLGKLQSGDRSWRDLTALDHHFCTQPLPNRISWYAHRLPAPLLRAATAATHVLEIAWPVLIFLGTGPRLTALVGLAVLQLTIFVTGNYNFFNLLALALGLLLVPDGTWAGLLPAPLMDGLRALGAPAPVAGAPSPAVGPVHAAVVGVLGGALALTSLAVFWRQHVPGPRLPRRLAGWLDRLRPFRTVNSYGLFRVMTTERPEIVVEGSLDGREWREYRFRYKPGDPGRAPAWAAPHQPRLDWQMWFAALGSWERSRWFRAFLARLLEGASPVTDLLSSTPFDRPPRYVRAVLYDYRFTTPAERRRTGDWWRRERLGPYGPTLSRSDRSAAG